MNGLHSAATLGMVAAYLFELSNFAVSAISGALVGILFYFFRPFLFGTGKARQASPAQLAAAVAPSIPQGQAMLYVYRQVVLAALTDYHVELDTATVAKLKARRFVRLPILSGSHTLVVGPKGFAARGNPPVTATFTASPGESVFFSIGIGIGSLTKNAVLLTREPDSPATVNHFATMTRVEPLL